MLWDIVVYCRILWDVVGCCGIMWDVGYCRMLWDIVVYCGMLWDIVGCCGILWFLSNKIKEVDPFGYDYMNVHMCARACYTKALQTHLSDPDDCVKYNRKYMRCSEGAWFNG